MNDWSGKIQLNQWYDTLEAWFQQHILSLENLFQVIVLGLTLLIGLLAGRPMAGFLKQRLSERLSFHVLVRSFFRHFLKTLPFLLGSLLLWIAILIFERARMGTFLLNLMLNLTVAWILVQLAASVILDLYWARFVTIVVWFFAALNIVGLFGPVINFLGEAGFTIGQTKLTMLSVLQAIILLAVLLKAVSWVSGHFEQRLTEVPGINSSTRLMLSKVTHVFLIVLASIVVLNTVGIDFSSLALFSGAIGVGVGFGLQKVVGNYISGLILLSDKSVKPGDVIQLADAFGWVRQMGGRYIAVVTRDEKEYLIPNEDLITQQVVNWSHTNNIIRLRVGFGVSYKSDPHQVIKLVLKAVKNLDRILDVPEPNCLLKQFGDSSVDFELHYWINDPQNGVDNINSDVLLLIWDLLKENNIEIPFPQRDLHFKS